jgi:hypothetical protein
MNSENARSALRERAPEEIEQAQRAAEFPLNRSPGQAGHGNSLVITIKSRFAVLSGARAPLLSGETGHKVDDASAHFLILDPSKSFVEVHAFRGADEVHDESRVFFGDRVFFAAAGGSAAVHWRPIEKESRGHVQRRRNLLQATGANSISALFIFLDLLKRQTQGFAEFLLTHSKKNAAHSDPTADMAVDRIRNLFHESKSP